MTSDIMLNLEVMQESYERAHTLQYQYEVTDYCLVWLLGILPGVRVVPAGLADYAMDVLYNAMIIECCAKGL